MDENRDDGMSVEEKCEEYTKAETSENTVSPITKPTEKGMWDWILSDDDDCSGDDSSDDTIEGPETKPQEGVVEGKIYYTMVESKAEPHGDTIGGPNTEIETDVLEYIKDKTNNGPKAEPNEDAKEGLKYDTILGPNTEIEEYAWEHIKDKTNDGSKAEPHEDAREGINDDTILGSKTEIQADVREYIKDKTNDGSKAEPHEDAREGTNDETILSPKTETQADVRGQIKDKTNDGSKAEPHEDTKEGLSDDTILAPKTEIWAHVGESVEDKTNDRSKAELHEDATEGTNDDTILGPKTEIWAHVGKSVEDKTNDRSKPYPHKNATKGMETNTKEELKAETTEDSFESACIQRSTNYFSKNETQEDAREGIKDKTKEGLKFELHEHADEDMKGKTNAESRTEQQKDATKDIKDTTNSKTSIPDLKTQRNDVSTTMFGTMKVETSRPGTTESSSPSPMVGILPSASTCKVSERTCTSFLGTTSTVASLVGTTKPNTSSSMFSVSTCGTSVSASGLTSTSIVTSQFAKAKPSKPQSLFGSLSSVSTTKTSLIATAKPRIKQFLVGSRSSVSTIMTSQVGTGKSKTPSTKVENTFSVFQFGVNSSTPGFDTTSKPGGRSTTGARWVKDSWLNRSLELQNEYYRVLCRTQVTQIGLLEKQNKIQSVRLSALEDDVSDLSKSERRLTAENTVLKEEVDELRKLLIRKEETLQKRTYTNHQFSEKSTQTEILQQEKKENQSQDTSKNEKKGQGLGTFLKFRPRVAWDSEVDNGVTKSVTTWHQCISAMISYQSKSLEELRLEDYLVNRKPHSKIIRGFAFGRESIVKASTGSGTSLKFIPPFDGDAMIENGEVRNIYTRHQCITAMQLSKTKSLEELRLEDYLNGKPHHQITDRLAFGRKTIEENMKQDEDSWTRNDFQSLHLQNLSDKVVIMVLQEELDELRELLIRKEETLQKNSEKSDHFEILQQESEAYQFMIKTKNELIENLTNQLKEKKREFKGLSKTNHRYLEQMAKMRLHCRDNPETPVKEMVSKICQTEPDQPCPRQEIDNLRCRSCGSFRC